MTAFKKPILLSDEEIQRAVKESTAGIERANEQLGPGWLDEALDESARNEAANRSYMEDLRAWRRS